MSMPRELTDPVPEDLLVIVVGAHLRAEVADRPIAETLCLEILSRQERAELAGPAPIVCSDLWYLNDQALQRRPTISVGAPEVNAATAHLGSRLATCFVIEGSLRIQLDPDYVDLRACLWGVDTAATATAVTLFGERYLDGFLDAAELVR
jgi:hypothetical protein